MSQALWFLGGMGVAIAIQFAIDWLARQTDTD